MKNRLINLHCFLDRITEWGYPDPPQRPLIFTGDLPIRWAKQQKLTVLELPALRWGGPTGEIDTETRWKQARWLLHDDTLRPEDRLAGLLVCSTPNGRP